MRDEAVVGRFAPSPTGWLHLGNARTALLAWLQARTAKGRFLLRIEDLDAARCRPIYTDGLKADLEWLGLGWDGPEWVQSGRGALYARAIERLLAEDRAYPCFCSRKEISLASAPHGESDEGPPYPGTCARLDSSQRSERARTRMPALRFRVREGEVAFTDEVLGEVIQDVARVVGDFVIRGRDGVPSYQLAVVVDDADNGITDVVRGADLVGSTPRQLLLYEALAAVQPEPTAQGGVPVQPERSAEREVEGSADPFARDPPSHSAFHGGADVADPSTPALRAYAQGERGGPREIPGTLYVPRFWHVPLLLGPDGKRLAKRDGPSTVRALRELGRSAEAVVGMLAGSCGLTDGAPISAVELASAFSPERLRAALVSASREQASLHGEARP